MEIRELINKAITLLINNQFLLQIYEINNNNNNNNSNNKNKHNNNDNDNKNINNNNKVNCNELQMPRKH